MIDFWDRLYASIISRNKFLKKIRYYSFLRFITRVCANSLTPIYFLLTLGKREYSIGTTSDREERIIVSLTSFPGRINKAWLVIETILRQTRKPDKIILWLSLEQFPSLDLLPSILLKQRDRGLEIKLRDGDLRSHKKYYYTFKEYPSDITITIDDDIFYPSSMIKELMKWSKIFPNAIIARYGFKIKVEDNEIALYKSWETAYQQESPNFQVFFGSGGGTLFPAHSLPKDTLDKDIFMNLCFFADDIWLNTMCRLNKKKIFKTNEQLRSILPILNKNKSSLSKMNLYENYNDKQLRDVRDYFISNKGIDPYLEILT